MNASENCRSRLGAFLAGCHDLPDASAKLLGLAHLVATRGARNVAADLGITIPSECYDPAWRWSNILQLAGLNAYWEHFVAEVRCGGTRRGVATLRSRVSAESFDKLVRYSGGLAGLSHKPHKHRLWTQGGCWDDRTSFARIIVQGKSVRRVYRVGWQYRLGKERTRLLEREVHNLCNPDVLNPYECRRLALSHVRRRLPEILGWKMKSAGPERVAWFFTPERIPVRQGKFTMLVHCNKFGVYVRSRMRSKRRRLWGWE